MHAASRHGTPSLTSLPKDDGVSYFFVVHRGTRIQDLGERNAS